MSKNRLADKSFEYRLGTPEISEGLYRARGLVQKLNTVDVNDMASKRAILRELFGEIGDDSDVNPNFYCDFGNHIFIGNNFFCNYNCTMLDVAEIHIGDNCLIGPNVSLYTAGHPVELNGRLNNIGTGSPIEIGNGVWIGGSCIIMGGVTIGDNSVIGAGSVVTHDIPANTLAYGNPARPIRKIEND